jgi:SAM-dependent methyltransferase
VSVIWHDLECGRYEADLPLWQELASGWAGPILDVGAGTGRVTLPLAREGHVLTALDRDLRLLTELERRAGDLDVQTVAADARDFDLDRQFGLCIVPMQTIQLLGGSEGRSAFLACARRHLRGGGRLAVAVADELEVFEVGPGLVGPLPDVCERDGTVYSSSPTAVRVDRGGFVLERRREVISPDGRLDSSMDRIRLDRLDPSRLEREAQAAGLTPAGRIAIPATPEYVGSIVVMLDA